MVTVWSFCLGGPTAGHSMFSFLPQLLLDCKFSVPTLDPEVLSSDSESVLQSTRVHSDSSLSKGWLDCSFCSSPVSCFSPSFLSGLLSGDTWRGSWGRYADVGSWIAVISETRLWIKLARMPEMLKWQESLLGLPLYGRNTESILLANNNLLATQRGTRN